MGLPARNDPSEGREENAVEICVVGAGPHGLAFLTHFLSPRQHLDPLDEHPRNAILYSHVHSADKSSKRPRIKCKVAENRNGTRSRRSGREIYEHFVSRSLATAHTITKELIPGLKVLESKSTSTSHRSCTRICVLDKCGPEFLRKWDTHFDVLDIPFLRSTTHQHPDPLDLGLLSSFAYHTKRANELIPLHLSGNPDQDHLRNQAFRGPYLRPSRELFRDFIRGLVKGFRLGEAVNCADLHTIEAVVAAPESRCRHVCGFRVTYKKPDGSQQTVFAKRVVLALGHANLQSVPEWVNWAADSAPRGRLLHYEDLISTMSRSRISERVDIGRHFCSLFGMKGDAISAPLKGMRVLIVGGGQTSVHLARVASLKLGANPGDITLMARSPLRSQPFDVSLEWLSTHRYESMADFWASDTKQRGQMLRQAKWGCNCHKSKGSGASVDAEWVNWLRSSGVQMREQCEVLSASWSTDSPSPEWEVEIWDERNDTNVELACDLIWLATGNAMDFLEESVVRSLRGSLKQYDVEIVTQGKLPILNEDLSLQLVSCYESRNAGMTFPCDDGVGVHVMGAYAALELGPGALNLMGARAGACRISRSIRDLYN